MAFVELPNTVEGMVRVETLPEGQYEFDGYFELKGKSSAAGATELVHRCGWSAPRWTSMPAALILN